MIPFEIDRLTNPSWTSRNKLIASMVPLGVSVLDMGCGAKDFLNYYQPTKYLGVDCVDTADVKIDLNGDLSLPSGWDFVINSGILEYLDDFQAYLCKVKILGNNFVFTWHPSRARWAPNKPVISNEDFHNILSQTYHIVEHRDWQKQTVVRCRPK